MFYAVYDDTKLITKNLISEGQYKGDNTGGVLEFQTFDEAFKTLKTIRHNRIEEIIKNSKVLKFRNYVDPVLVGFSNPDETIYESVIWDEPTEANSKILHILKSGFIAMPNDSKTSIIFIRPEAFSYLSICSTSHEDMNITCAVREWHINIPNSFSLLIPCVGYVWTCSSFYIILEWLNKYNLHDLAKEVAEQVFETHRIKQEYLKTITENLREDLIWEDAKLKDLVSEEVYKAAKIESYL